MKQPDTTTPAEPVTRMASPPPTKPDPLRAAGDVCDRVLAEGPHIDTGARAVAAALRGVVNYLATERTELLTRIAALQADVEHERRSSTLVFVPEKPAVQP